MTKKKKTKKKIKQFRCMTCNKMTPDRHGIYFDLSKDTAIKLCKKCLNVAVKIDEYRLYE